MIKHLKKEQAIHDSRADWLSGLVSEIKNLCNVNSNNYSIDDRMEAGIFRYNLITRKNLLDDMLPSIYTEFEKMGLR